MDIGAEEFVSWRGQKANPEKHGGVRAASLACAAEVLENLAFLSNAINFVTYLIKTMHYPIAEAANMVTNFLGTSFLLTIFGGFISDSFFTRFKSFIIFCAIELLGLILLTIQSNETRLQPELGRRPTHTQAAILFTGLYAIALGVGGMKASLPAHGADQFDHSNQRLISGFFNWYFFSLCAGGLLACTVMVWVQENLGWNWGFKISIVVLGLALFIFVVGFPVYRFKRPGGSPISRIVKVLVSTIRNWKAPLTPVTLNNEMDGKYHNKLRFLDKALVDDTINAVEVEDTKTFMGLLPIFGSTIMMNCCLAQLQTFSVEQGSVMNRNLNNFQIPTQSMAVFPLVIMLISIPLYESSLEALRKKGSYKHHSFFLPLRRIGLGLALASGSMAVAALVEVKRQAAAERGVRLSVFWLSWQYILLGISDMLTLGGMLEFFYSEAPDRMRSMSTALSWCSTSMGYFISSFLVTIINAITGKLGHEWLGGKDLNHNRLDLFYTVLCVLNFINLLNYMYWAKRF